MIATDSSLPSFHPSHRFAFGTLFTTHGAGRQALIDYFSGLLGAKMYRMRWVGVCRWGFCLKYNYLPPKLDSQYTLKKSDVGNFNRLYSIFAVIAPFAVTDK
jgi:hypothetical protein